MHKKFQDTKMKPLPKTIYASQKAKETNLPQWQIGKKTPSRTRQFYLFVDAETNPVNAARRKL